MNYLAAMLLMHVTDEEDVFWVFCVLIEDLATGYFDQGMIETRVDQMVFNELLDERIPALAAHLSSLGFDISCVTSKWVRRW